MTITKNDQKTILRNSGTLMERHADSLLHGVWPEALSLKDRWCWEQQLNAGWSRRVSWLQTQRPFYRQQQQIFQSQLDTLQGWIMLFRKILEQYENLEGASLGRDPDADRRQLPFADLLVPFVNQATTLLTFQADLPVPSLQAQLLNDLHEESAFCFLEDYQRFCRENHRKDTLQGYFHHMRKGRIVRFFKQYSSLARRLTRLVNDWAYANSLLGKRLSEDKPHLQEALFGDNDPGPLVDVLSGNSLPHSSQGAVRILIFASGQKLIYKPRSGDTDQVLNRIVDWLNRQNLELDLKGVRCLPGKAYCWYDFVDHQSCADKSELSQFYHRIGYWGALATALGSTDLHSDNIVAHGAYPILIDTESLFNPLSKHIRENVIRAYEERKDGTFPAFVHSFLFLGYEQLRNPHSTFPSGVFSNHYKLPVHRIRQNEQGEWCIEEILIEQRGKNIPTVAGRKARPSAFIPEMEAGYREMACLLSEKRDELYKLIGACTNNFSLNIRFTLRETPWYLKLRESLRQPALLQSGVQRSMALERIARFYLDRIPSQEEGLLLREETECLQAGYIPAFRQPMNQLGYGKAGASSRVFCRHARGRLKMQLARFSDRHYLEEQLELFRQILQASRI